MLEASDRPNVFAIPPGADFPKALVDGLRERFANDPPEALARVELVVNSARMQRRVRDVFDKGPAGLLPRIRLLSDFGGAAFASDIPAAVSPLRRRFELVRLIAQLLETQPDLAARASLFDLADSLATLMSEMNGEGVTADDIEALDISDQSGHWERSLAFFGIARRFLETVDDMPDSEARQRLVIERLAERWQTEPPDHPIILAGSTGSRGTTMLLMQAIAKLPRGAIVLPGFDDEMPDTVWDVLGGAMTGDGDALSGEDHPQFRFRRLMHMLEIAPGDVRPWLDIAPPCKDRNRLVSLALRPAPVTDQWLSEGPKLGPVDKATAQMTLLEAPSVREEAMAIALGLRQAAEEGRTAALISPDRALTRQVTAALDRWGILPDDSAGTPLQLSPPGRFLRHVSALFRQKLTSEALLTLLKHPLCNSSQSRNDHLLRTRALELWVRRKGVAYPDSETLRAWGEGRDQEDRDWLEWLLSHLVHLEDSGEQAFSDRLERHITVSEALAQGPTEHGCGALWEKAAGRKAAEIVADLRENAKFAGPITASDYDDLFGAVLSRGEVRDRDAPHPKILIWGTLEARVQGAELVILGGLNEGSWPEALTPDPWLNRKMRHDAGLLLPERKIGLSAHDFEQAIAAPEVWLTRSIRSDEAETVPSRWINRLTNLLEGLPKQGGPAALKKMRERGERWLSYLAELEHVDPIDAEKRPSPRPPSAARPKSLSVTEIKTLIRDPYAIYAKHVLRLKPLDSLMKTPDAILRGIAIHDILETFVRDATQDPTKLNRAHLMSVTEDVLSRDVPWATARTLYRARLERVADHVIEGEKTRRTKGKPIAYEREASVEIPIPPMRLVGKADRIDRIKDGRLVIYDYKSGKPPSAKEQEYFDKQLLLEAAMAERGGFRDIDPAEVAEAIYIGLSNDPKDEAAPLEKTPAAQVWEEFIALMAHYADRDTGFTSRRAFQSEKDVGRYDQLARFGEWDATDAPEPEDMS
ncbi:double-strand break repair protein AddB [Shimia sp. FJ5]|uniref:double-strand break repair protein AddB n=1 Tax=Shimia sp. FJ5 TaxID=3079054 RepID=UPI0026062F2E|nr:double-strand break repair protein AddB [Shimia sp. FJ5]MDV4144674.1 double-strand break repair protein AddB [Shimia sp. FJ5]